MKYDVVVLTDRRYLDPQEINPYVENVLLEDKLVVDALTANGLTAVRKSWDDPNFDWRQTKAILFRTTWDYFDRFEVFEPWLKAVSEMTHLINSAQIIQWNIHKGYLVDLQARGIEIPSMRLINQGETIKLAALFNLHHWEKAVLKPAVSGAARHTYVIDEDNVREYELLFQNLIAQEDMILQEFQSTIHEKGEASIVVIGGEGSHSVLKKAKSDDFRVQDDFGGTLHEYYPDPREKQFAESVIAACPFNPLYARVDIMWSVDGNPVLGELELIEPELWFRRNTAAANKLALAIKDELNQLDQAVFSLK